MVTKTPQKALAVRTVVWKALTWVNIEGPTLAEMEYLKQRYAFHPLALDDCLSRVQLPKMDEFENYVFLVLHFPVYNKTARITQPSQVSIFVGADYVVTIHRGDPRPLAKLFQDCEHSEEVRGQIMERSSGYLLYQVLDVLVDYCFPILNKINENVDRVEEHLFERNAGVTVRELSIIRRDVIAYRRIIRPQINVMETLEKKEIPLLKVDPDIYFGDLADHTRHIWEELEELKEVTDGLNDSVFTLNTYIANDVVRILTVIFTLILPVTVISGLYGMNVKLPLASHPWTFSVLALLTFVVSALMLLLFRWRRWL